MEEINEKKTHKWKTIKRLLKYVAPYKWKTIGIVLMLLLIMSCNTLNPYLMKVSIDKFVSAKDVNGLLGIGAVLLLLNIIAMILSKIRMLSMSKITNQILVNIRHELYTHIQTLSFSFFDSRPVGKILSRVVGDVNALNNLLNHSIVNLIPNLFTILLVIFMMFLMDPSLTLVCLTVLPFLFAGMFFIEIKSNKRWRVFRENRSALLGYTHEAFSGMKVVQGFNREEYSREKFENHLEGHAGVFLHAVRLQDYFWPTVDICRCFGIAIVLFAGYKLTRGGNLSLGTLMAFIMYIEMLWRPIMNLSAFYNAFVTNLSAAERIFDIMDTKNHMVNNKAEEKLPKIKGEIHFEDVTFFYDNDGNHALKDVTFTLNPGEKIALVGETGAGKTTITNLISRFYEPTKGKIFIDGIDISTVDVESLRSQMGIMLQDSFLFASSIKENIRYGKLDATDEEIIQAAKAVNAHNFIEKLEEGYNTNVNERGSRLSLGQRQLIAFARALISDPRILILDEATANIDTETERLVQEGIKKLMEGRTSIVIAHRLSTIRDCDKIFVLSHGKIVEEGTHEELLNRKSSIPNIFTFINLSFGILSLLATFKSEYLLAAIFILLAGLVDRYDGRVARYLNVSSDLGKELDSLADLVSFGVAPSVLTFVFYNFESLGPMGIIGYALLLCFPICGAFRLARYNATEFDGVFRGVPITIAGAVVALFILLSIKFTLNILFPVVILVVFSYLMVSNLQLKKF
ncbi:CDP-diacylglycerol--serine O-phosphatidyltransferase [Clostridium perfringens]|uniref:CDP-diacylglycerol--serine O-phosphatidyltransferase n=6 Tax=Clostridium perfringens TaxID=1502 RepID=UPI003754C70B